MNTNKFYTALLCGASALQLGYSLPAIAQEGTDGADNEIADIIVTANRREETMQKVPTAITAFTGETLRREGVTSNQDLAGKVPSLIVGQAAGQRDTQTFTIRGQGSTFGGGPGVAVYFAEVPLPQRSDTVGQIGTGTLFYDLENVQVLKGPQGTLFGRNTTGGAVLVEPAKPKNQFDGYVQGQLGNYHDREFEAMVNVPVVEDKLLLRVAGRYAKRDGYTQEINTNRDLDNRDYWTLRAGLTWRPTETIENYLLVTNVKVDQNGTGTVFAGFNSAINPATGNFQGSNARFYGIPLLTQVLAEQQARGPRKTELTIVPLEEQRLFMVTDVLKIDLSDNLTLRNIASYARYKTRASFDQDGSRLDMDGTGPGDANSTDARQWTEEFQLQGKFLDDRLNFVTGVYHEDAKPVGSEIRQGSAQGSFLTFASGDHRKSTGVYAQAALEMGALTSALEGFRLTGGYRYSWDKKESFSALYSSTACVLADTTPFPDCRIDATYKSSAPNWLLSLDYQVTPDTMVYAKVSRGYKSGGYNFNGVNPQARTFGPEFATAYEGGVKSQFHLGAVPVRLNLDYYYTSYKDIQRSGATVISLPSGNSSGGSAIVNAGKAHIQGIEADVTVNPFPNLSIRGAYSYTKANYDKFQFSYFSGGQVLVDDRSAVPFSFTPKNQYSISARYDIKLDDMQTIAPSLTFSHIDRYYTQITRAEQEPFGYLPESNLLNLRVEWNNVGRRPVDLAFFMTNVANKTFPIQLQANYGKNGANYGSGFLRYIYSEPRMWGFQLRYRFGASGQ